MAALLSALLILAACTPLPPVELTSQYTPPRAPVQPTVHPRAREQAAAATCHIRFGEIADLRTDPQSMGAIGYRAIHAGDPLAWLRSGLQTLGQDSRIGIVDGTGEADLELKAELLKSYILSQNTQKSANVVVRIRYSLHGEMLGEQIFRGTDIDVNWAGGTEESQSALDRALTELLTDLRRDILARCSVASQSEVETRSRN